MIRRCARLSLRLLAAIAVTTLALPAFAAAPPDGSRPISPSHEPSICTSGEFDEGASAYGPTYGYYWSKKAKSWISRPRCYPRWGFLSMTPSLIVQPGKPVTMTAIPQDGSNSGQYAPVTGTISWQYSGTRISGCGASDMSCTVLPNATATSEWQWFEFHVSMPKTFYVDDPGEFCGGRHLCAGATTNAWGFVGLPPKEMKGEIFGAVMASKCGKDGCKLSPAPGVALEATAEIEDETQVLHAVSGKDGGYRFVAEAGTWTVRPDENGRSSRPAVRTVEVEDNKKAGPADFTICGADPMAPSSSRSSAMSRAPAAAGGQCPDFYANAVFNSDLPPIAAALDGFGFNPRGGKILIRFNGEIVKRYPASEQFHERFYHNVFYPQRGNGDYGKCSAIMSAEQDSGYRYAAVLEATGNIGTAIFTNNPKFKVGNVLCENEDKLAGELIGTVVFKSTLRSTEFPGQQMVLVFGDQKIVALHFSAGDRKCINVYPGLKSHISLESKPVGFAGAQMVVASKMKAGKCP